MNECILPVGVSMLACAIAGEVTDNDDLNILASLFTVLGDTLASISAQRAARDK